MHSYRLKYGREIVEVPYSEQQLLGIIQSRPEADEKAEEAIVIQALQNPIHSPRLKEMVKPGEKICIVISDITRAWQKMSFYLPYIVEELQAGGIADQDILFLSATGSHRNQSEEEHKVLLGEKLYKRFKVIDHDSRDQGNMVYLGTTSYGTPVKVNKIALDCDHIVLTGAVVYHDLAGWGGGKKSILPGISSYESIMANHALSLNPEIGTGIHPQVRCGSALENPLNLDMLEAAAFVNPSFLFNVIINEKGNIGQAVAGHYVKAHEAGQQIVDEFDSITIGQRADLVIVSAGGYPKDINLYQASKALVNAKEALKPGGTVILLSECEEGFGHDEVEDLLLNYENNQEREAAVRQDYTVSKFIGYLIAEIAAAYQIILVSKISPEKLAKVNIQGVATLEEALQQVETQGKAGQKLYLMPYGASTLPKWNQ